MCTMPTPNQKIVKRNRASTYIIPSHNSSKSPDKNTEWNSDDATVSASNLSADLRGWSDDDTSATEPITDESDSDSESCIDRIPITIPAMVYGATMGGQNPIQERTEMEEPNDNQRAEKNSKTESKIQTQIYILGQHGAREKLI